MTTNGHQLGTGRLLQKAVKFEYNEMMFRAMAGQVKQDAEKMGGAFPMPDPAGFLAFTIVLDKLNALMERMDALEAKLPGIKLP